MLQLAVLAFNGLSLTTKLIAIGSILAAITLSIGVLYAKVESSGHDRALREVAAGNARSIKRAQEYRGQWRDCDARGLRWRTSTGQCE
jgi:hypothetical protein